jgi:integrase
VVVHPRRLRASACHRQASWGVLINDREKKFASAHDLRRSFGTRWASRVKPVVLQKLMRHANIQTTLTFYVSLDSDDVASQLWANYSQDAEVNETSDETLPILATSRAHADEAV